MRLFRFRGRFGRTTSGRFLILLTLATTIVFLLRQNGFFWTIDDVSSNSDLTLPSVRLQNTVQFEKHHDMLDSPSTKTKDLLVTTTTSSEQERFTLKTLETSLDVKRYRAFVNEHNSRQEVENTEAFTATLSEKSLVIVVQVHSRPDYFEYLIKSLRAAKGISDALLVISHDLFSEDMNRLVKTIDFCKVMQIFFPYTIQLYPNQFPGTDPNDCPRDISKAKALQTRCNNAEHPDKYGHYREARFTMTKHHWWWKANTVFDSLNITRNYNGPVLFLEEDHFVAPDFYHVLHLLYDRKLNHRDCREDRCDIMTLGTYKDISDFKAVGENLACKSTWKSVDHNMGMAFDRNMWNEIKKCSEMFCSYDDYNWDWTLMKISMNCHNHRWKALVMEAPRVFHIGECGVHHKKKQCNTKLFVSKFEGIIERNKASLFPSSLVLKISTADSPNLGQPNGGWGDIRDHKLCLQFVKKNS